MGATVHFIDILSCWSFSCFISIISICLGLSNVFFPQQLAQHLPVPWKIVLKKEAWGHIQLDYSFVLMHDVFSNGYLRSTSARQSRVTAVAYIIFLIKGLNSLLHKNILLSKWKESSGSHWQNKQKESETYFLLLYIETSNIFKKDFLSSCMWIFPFFLNTLFEVTM